MSLRERLAELIDRMTRDPNLRVAECANAAARLALEEAARECIRCMRDSGDEPWHERCADAVSALAEGLD